MSFLAFKTRGDSSPQGKQRVYFVCHPDDFNRYFDEIADDIFKSQNCAIYYKSREQDYAAEELFAELEQMQLFVVPITTKLLTDTCSAMSAEIPFAIEHHIPILPLMQEAALYDFFAYSFGDIQYLDKNDHDITAISYEVKLEKFLSSILIGDKLAQQIRDAFDAYIFLSYRKKDRMHAQELMRLIHKNDFAQSVAIWYDEFLVPGENFNEAIAAAMEKSGLFALAVTPNLINEPNYVMSVEYPEALRHHKPILPVELVKTDRDALAEQYPGIPCCTDAYNAEELSVHLLTALKNIALSGKDADPQHKLFIGLAYLNGIDVEVAHERALSMITESAEAELPEAIDWLVRIYQEGISVKKNTETAIYWQKRLVEIRERNYCKDNNKETCAAYITDLSYLSSLYIAAYDYDHAKSVSERQLKICKAEEASYQLHEEVADVLYDLGKISNSLGDTDTALTYYHNSLSSWTDISKNNPSEKAAFTKACIYRSLAHLLYYNIEKTEDALKYYHLGISEIENTSMSKTSNRMLLSSLYYDIARLYSNTDRPSHAIHWYEKALIIEEQLSAETDSFTAKNNLLLTYIKFAEALSEIYMDDLLPAWTYKCRKEKQKALSFVNKAIAISSELLEKEDTIASKLACSSCYLAAGETNWRLGETSSSIDCVNRAVLLSEEIYNKAPCIAHTRNLFIAYSTLGQYLDDNPSEAAKYHLKSYQLSQKLLGLNIAMDLRSHAVLCGILADTYIEQKKLPEAKSLLEEGSSCLQRILDPTYESKLVQADLIHRSAKISEYEGDYDQALAYLMDELTIREDITADADARSPYMDLSVVYSELSTVSLKLGDDFGASKWGIMAFKSAANKKYNPNRKQTKKMFTRAKVSAWFSLLYGTLGLLCTAGLMLYLVMADRMNEPLSVEFFHFSVPTPLMIIALAIICVGFIIFGLISLRKIRRYSRREYSKSTLV